MRASIYKKALLAATAALALSVIFPVTASVAALKPIVKTTPLVITSQAKSFIVSWKISTPTKKQLLTVLSGPHSCMTLPLSPLATSATIDRSKLSNCGPQVTFNLTTTPKTGPLRSTSSASVSSLPPAAPQVASVVSGGSSSAVVTWIPVAGTAPASSYTITLSNGVKQIISPQSPPTVTFNNLKPGSVVAATVTANTPGVVVSPTISTITTPASATIGQPTPTLNIVTDTVSSCPSNATLVATGCQSEPKVLPATPTTTYSCASPGVSDGKGGCGTHQVLISAGYTTDGTAVSHPAIYGPAPLIKAAYDDPSTGGTVHPAVYGPAPLISAAVAAYDDPATGGTYHAAVPAVYGPAPVVTPAVAAYTTPVVPGAHHAAVPAVYGPAPLISAAVAAYTDPSTGGTYHAAVPAVYGPAPLISAAVAAYTTPVVPGAHHNATSGAPYSCAQGTLYQTSNCNILYGVAQHLNYSCSSGTLSGSNCVTTTSSSHLNYSCSSGTLSGTNCYSVSAWSVPLTCSGTIKGSAPNQTCWVLIGSATDNQYCPGGGTLSGNTCTTVLGAATENFYCPSGGSLSNGWCQSIVAATPTVTAAYDDPSTGGVYVPAVPAVYGTAPLISAAVAAYTDPVIPGAYHAAVPAVYGPAPLISAAVAAYDDPSTGGVYVPAVPAVYGPAPLISAAVAAYTDPVIPAVHHPAVPAVYGPQPLITPASTDPVILGAHHDAVYGPAPIITPAYTDPTTPGIIHPAVYNSVPYPAATATTTYSCSTGTLSVDKCLVPASNTPVVNKVVLTLTATNALSITVDGSTYTAPVDVTACTVDHTVTATGLGGSITKTVACTKR